MSTPFGLASLTPSERAWFAGWLRDAFALACLVGICAAFAIALGVA
jgi:hypothetical protein